MEVWTYNLCIIVPCFMLKVKGKILCQRLREFIFAPCFSLFEVSTWIYRKCYRKHMDIPEVLPEVHGYTGSATGSAWIYRKCYWIFWLILNEVSNSEIHHIIGFRLACEPVNILLQRTLPFIFLKLQRDEILSDVLKLENSKACQDTDNPKKTVKENADIFANVLVSNFYDSIEISHFPSIFKRCKHNTCI